jgi:hypothetical protein
MERINGQTGWIQAARQPCAILDHLRQTSSVQYAWAVKDSEDELDEAAIPDAEDMFSACCGLVVIDKESEIIRLVHYTLQEYFQDALPNDFRLLSLISQIPAYRIFRLRTFQVALSRRISRRVNDLGDFSLSMLLTTGDVMHLRVRLAFLDCLTY